MKHIFQKIRWFVYENRRRYILLLFLLITISLVSLTPAYVLGLSIDTIVSEDLTRNTLILLVGGLVLLPVIRYILSFIYNQLSQKTAQELTFQMRKRYLAHLFDMDSSFYETYEKGDLITRVTSDLDAITQAASNMLEGIVFNVGIIIFALIVMAFTISWQLTLISVSIMPIALTLLNYIRIQKRKYIKIHSEIYANMTGKVLESVEGQKAIRAYVQEENDLKKQFKAIEADIESWRYIVKYENWFNPLFDVVYGIAYILAFGFGIYFIMNQQITLGELIIFVSYIGMLNGPIIAISNIFSQINNAIVSVDRLDQVMQHIPVVHDEVDSKPIVSFKTIEFKEVTFKYPFDKQPVINKISFQIHHGETIGIVGPTGAGKSTLIRQLLREFNITEGEIFIDGNPIETFKIEDIRNLVGYVPQTHMLFRRSVEDNIMIGNPIASHQAFDLAVKMADFEKDLAYLHNDLETMVGEAGATLSGGQKQRLSIARALVKDPQILILDDSLSAVDAKTEDTIIEHLKDFRKGKTNIIVAHRFSAVRDADRIYVLQNGRITQSGSHLELLNQEGWYKMQYIQQMMVK